MDNVKEIKLFPKGVIHIPPSKSVAHRAVICAALANGQSRIENIAFSEDIRATIDCMSNLGAEIVSHEDALDIRGGPLSARTDTLDCGESGSALRFLIPIAGLLDRPISFTGRGRLMERPVGPYTDALQKNGAALTSQNGLLTVRGPLKAGTFALPGDVSSQFVTGLLLALPLLNEESRIVLTSPLQSAPYVDITIDVMKSFGVEIINEDYKQFIIPKGQRYTAQHFRVEGDYSQAAFFLAAAALGCGCQCAGLSPSSRQGDKRILDILGECGAKVSVSSDGNISVKADKLTAVTVDVSDIPDLVPALAVLFTFCEGTSRIVNAGRLRLKECDRLTAVASELNALGANIEEAPDSLTIHGVASLKGGKVKDWNDHRIPMAMAAAAVRSSAPVFIEGYNCVAKSYPNFWNDFEKVRLEDTL